MASLNRLLPNFGFFEDQFSPNSDLEFNNRPVERFTRLLSEIVAEPSSEDVPVFDDSSLDINQKKPLGFGGKANVYKALLKQGKTLVEVAVKVPKAIKSNQSISLENKNTIQHVRQQMQKLKQENFVEYYGVYHDLVTQKTCIVMEQLNGKSLAFHLANSYKQMSFKNKIGILLQSANALYFAHSKDILVTDFKPDNIVFDKLPDFEGNTNIHLKLIDVTERDFTIAYSSIEGLNENFSKNTDIYTFGVVVWQMFTGKAPYSECKNDCQRAMKIADDHKLEIPDDVPEALKDLMRSCWSSPCTITMEDVVNILNDVSENIDTFEYTTSPIPIGLF